MLSIIRKHSGRYNRTGGEYGIWETYKRVRGKVLKSYHSTSEIEDPPPPEVLEEEEIEKLAKEIDASLEETLAKIDAKREYVVDLTGHEEKFCKAFGGCYICYPPGCTRNCRNCSIW